MKKLQVYIIISSSVSCLITFISSVASSSSEGEMNGFTASLLSTKIYSWEFSFCLPALQGCPFFKQWIKSSSIPSKRFKPQQLIDFMFSLDSWEHASSTHSIIFFLEGGFIFPPSVNWWTPSPSHLSYNLVILAFNDLLQYTGAWMYFVYRPGRMIMLSTFISFKSFLMLSVIWHL